MTRQAVLAVLQANLLKIVESARGKELSESLSMKDLGADSLEAVEVASRTMKELKIRVPRTELSKATNVGQLVDLLVKHGQAATAAP